MAKSRMYHLVMYNISPIQQGIQAHHAGIEYANKYFDDDEYKLWRDVHKTIIILNGGTSQNIGIESGTMELHRRSLFDNNIKYAVFHEPDLNYSTSAIAFLTTEHVWDKGKYPDFEFENPSEREKEYNTERYLKWVYDMGGEKNVWLREFLSQFRTV